MFIFHILNCLIEICLSTAGKFPVILSVSFASKIKIFDPVVTLMFLNRYASY